MIEGVVNDAHEAVVSLSLQDSQGQTRRVEAVIDTGYNRSLTLPTSLVMELGSPFVSTGRAFLENDNAVDFDVHDVTILWDGEERQVEVDAVGSTPLVGMLLLDGHRLNIEVERGGRVIIQRS